MNEKLYTARQRLLHRMKFREPIRKHKESLRFELKER